MTHAEHEVVIVGGGHNGLVAAAYLASAGRSVLLLERDDHVGGAAVSAPAFIGVDARLSRYSYLVSLLPQRIIDELGLDIRLVRRRFSSYTPDPADPSRGLLVDNADPNATRESFVAIGAEADAASWTDFYATTARMARAIFPTLTEPLPTREEARRMVGDDEAWDAFIERSLGQTIEARFDDDLVRGVVATDGLIGTFTDLDDPALDANRCFLYHVIGGGTGDWDVPIGGMGAVSGELERAARKAGARVVTGADVLSVTPDGEVRYLRDGVERVAHGGWVLANVAPVVLERMLGAGAGDLDTRARSAPALLDQQDRTGARDHDQQDRTGAGDHDTRARSAPALLDQQDRTGAGDLDTRARSAPALLDQQDRTGAGDLDTRARSAPALLDQQDRAGARDLDQRWSSRPRAQRAAVSRPADAPEGAQVKVNLMLTRLPRLRDTSVSPEAAFGGTFHINERYGQLERAYEQAAGGDIPDVIPCEVYCHSLSDPSILSPELAASGAQTLTVFALHVPDRLMNTGDEDDLRARLQAAVLASLDSVLAEPIADVVMLDANREPCIETKTTRDIERAIGMPGGNIFHGPLSWPFLEDDEPSDTPPDRWGVATAHPRILLCGSGARRGGAVSGIGGHNAAMAVLESE